MRRARLATLGVPLQDAVPAWVAAGIVGLFYAWTASRDLSAFDSAELALAAYQGGLAHPPGHALYTLVGWIVTRLPASPLFVLALLSAVPAALSVLPIASIAESMAPGPRASWARWMGVAVFVAVSLHAATWEPATRVEVYTFAGFLCLLSFSWAAEIRAREALSWRAIAAMTLPLGLATGANAALAVVSTIACVVATLPVARRMGLRRAAAGAAAFVAGAAVNVYVVLAPIEPGAFTWGKPRTLDALFAFVRGADYAQNAGITWEGLLDHLVALWVDHGSRGLLIVLVGGAAAHVALGRVGLGRVAPVLVLVAAWVGVAANRIFVIGIPDYDGYAWTAVMLGCAGLVAVARRADGATTMGARVLGPAVAIAVVATIAFAPPLPWARTRSDDRALREMAAMMLRDAPPRALMLVAADHVAAPMLWLHEAEGMRADVVVLPVGLASSRWYWDHLAIRHPSIRPFAVVGAGGKRGRIERLLRANPALVPVTDQAGSVAELGWDECVDDVGAVARVAWRRDACASGRARGSDARVMRDATTLAGWIDRLADGSPSTDEAVGAVAYARGVRAWRSGRTDLAFTWLASSLRADERAIFAPSRGAVARAPRIGTVPALPQTRPIFDRVASRAALCAMIEMSGARAPSVCSE